MDKTRSYLCSGVVSFSTGSVSTTDDAANADKAAEVGVYCIVSGLSNISHHVLLVH